MPLSFAVNMNILNSAFKTHIHTNHTQPCHAPTYIKMLTNTKTTEQAITIGLDWIQSYKPTTVTATIIIPTAEAPPPPRMGLTSYLTIRTLLFFESLIGLVDKPIKGDPQS